MKSMHSRVVQCLILLMAVLVIMTAGSNYRLEAQQAGLPPEVVHYADVVLYNGKILTVDENFAIVDAVAMRDGKFLAVGTTDRVLPLAGPKTRRIDLKGKTALPGFVDTHQHPFAGGLQTYLRSKYKIRPETWTVNNAAYTDISVTNTNVDAAYRDIGRVVRETKPGEAVLAASSFQLFCSTAKLEPLDAISPNNPVAIVQAPTTLVRATTLASSRN